jgi:FeS assembly SUF system protein
MTMPDQPNSPPPLPPLPGEVLAPRSLEEQVIDTIRTVYDPEIPVNIYEMGLIYGVDTTPDGDVAVTMTLTTPNCPAAQSLPSEVEAKINALPGVREATVNVTFEPPWSQDMMSEAAKLELGMF